MESDYLSGLSDVQHEAVTATEGPSLVIAGAGSGKTRVLTYRIAYLLQQGVQPWSILALTFTNKAAKEMKERISTVVGEKTASMLWMGTFHSIFAKILRNEAERLGFNKSFTIYDTTDSKGLIRQIVRELQLDPKVYKESDVLSRISMAKNNLVTPQAYANNSSITTDDAKQRKSEIYRIYAMYAQRCYKSSAMDFDDLLLNTNILFRDFPDALEKYQQKFRYILVDEYQDTNYSQYLIVKKLAELYRNVCVVGDDAQSIYSFRGAKIENILNYKTDYPDYKLFKLEQNYRSTQTIVNAANSIIDKNKNQIKKVAFSSNDEGEKIKIISAFTDQEEASLVAGDIADIVQREHCQYSDFAILYRTNAQSRSFEETLRKHNIPYRVFGSLSFYQRKEIKDLLAYLRLTVNLNDDESLRRVINVPARGIGETTVSNLQNIANANGQTLWNAIVNLGAFRGDIKPAAVNKIMGFAQIIGSNKTRALTDDAYEMAYAIANNSGIIAELRLDKSLEGMSRLQNVEELLNSIKEFVESRKKEGETEVTTLTEYLENVALLTDMDTDDKEDKNRVSVMTVHASKGLEFDYVFLAGLEENLFPSTMTGLTPSELEEERRLFYVAVTRAAKKVTISNAHTRMRWGQVVSNAPSRFIKDIDPQFIDSKISKQAMHLFSSSQQTREISGAVKARLSPRTLSQMPRVAVSQAATKSSLPSINPDLLEVGMPVAHERFGTGTVVSIEGEGANRRAVVNFDRVGKKNLLLKFANLKKC